MLDNQTGKTDLKSGKKNKPPPQKFHHAIKDKVAMYTFMKVILIVSIKFDESFTPRKFFLMNLDP